MDDRRWRSYDEIEAYLKEHPDDMPQFPFMIPHPDKPGHYYGARWNLEKTLEGLKGKDRQREKAKWFKYRQKGHRPFGLPGKTYHNITDVYKDMAKVGLRITSAPEYGTVKDLKTYALDKYRSTLNEAIKNQRDSYFIQALKELIDEICDTI